MSTELTSETVQPAQPGKVVFDGRGGELFVVYLVNILLTMVTLGIYRFWGKTRIREYVWSHLRYKGDAFEYTGTGMELFLGFLIVALVVFAPLFGLTIWAQVLIGEGEDMLAAAIIIPVVLAYIVLFPMAIYRAYRYRLSRSLWRGIRFGLSGKPSAYARKFIGYTLLQIITLGLATPYARVRLYEILISNIWMGSGRFTFEAPWKPLMKRFTLLWVALVLTIGAAAIVQTQLIGIAAPQSPDFGNPDMFPPENSMLMAVATMISSVGGIVVVCLYLYYSAFEYRYIVSHIKFENVGFSVDMKVRQLFGLYVVNGLLLLFTLGIAFPWVIVRILNFIAAKLEIHGEPDFEKISQNTEEMPKYGEGLAEAFDIGAI